jgi:HIT domain
MRRIVLAVICLGVGVLIGGYLFSGVEPRSVLALPECGDSCFRASDLAGLVASVGIQRKPRLLPLPNVVKETERCITIRHPFSNRRVHFVSFPKRDIKNIGSMSVEDGPYVMECFAHMQALVGEHHLRAYRVMSNGPLLQSVGYLHFHLIAR